MNFLPQKRNKIYIDINMCFRVLLLETRGLCVASTIGLLLGTSIGLDS